MKSIEQVKSEFAFYWNFKNFDDVLRSAGNDSRRINVIIDALMSRYAGEALKEAAERAVVFLPSHPHLHGTKNIDEHSILSVIKDLK